MSVKAQELLLYGGITYEHELAQNSYGWGVEYNQGLGEQSYFSLGWINEGHLEAHHRDGPVVQIGRRFQFPEHHFTLWLGLGPYAYFDTALAEQGAAYSNDHGFGLVFSGGINWYIESPWLFHLRINRIETDTHIDTTALLLGVGYQLAPADGSRSLAATAQHSSRSELTVFVGQTVLNSFRSENSVATAIEYRQGIGSHLDWTLGFLHEGAHHIIRRNGITTQLWAVRSFQHDHLVLGAGAGAYFLLSKEHVVDDAIDENENISGIITLTAGYKFQPHWRARMSWNRIVTGYSRDTDVFLLGCGYIFQ